MSAQNTSQILSNGNHTLVGWVPTSSGRGTASLIASCVATTALCTWIVIHPRIYTDKSKRLPHKIALWLKTIIAPELLAIEALQEWMQARRLVIQCNQFTHGQFKLVQAFYIGMFGVHYRTTHGSRVLWPNQFLWLLKQNLFTWESHESWGLDREIIEDKSNADTTAKVLALAQVIWFVIQIIMRWAHNLPLAPLETMTLCYIPLFGVTYFCWWQKPKDISTPSLIMLEPMGLENEKKFLSMSIEDSFDNEGTCKQTSMWNIWALTPRVFEQEAKEAAWQADCKHYDLRKDCHRHHLMTCKAATCRNALHIEPEPPVPREETTVSHWDPEVYHSRILWLSCCVFGVSFPGLHLLSWNAIFPSDAETWLWRAASIASIASMLGFMHFEKIVVRWQDPLMVLKVSLPLMYLVTRLILLACALAAFRAMDPAVYDTYVLPTV